MPAEPDEHGTRNTPACNELLNMIDVGVPPEIVVKTMGSSGLRYSEADLACLTAGGASDLVLSEMELLLELDGEREPGEPGSYGEQQAIEE